MVDFSFQKCLIFWVDILGVEDNDVLSSLFSVLLEKNRANHSVREQQAMPNPKTLLPPKRC